MVRPRNASKFKLQSSLHTGGGSASLVLAAVAVVVVLVVVVFLFLFFSPHCLIFWNCDRRLFLCLCRSCLSLQRLGEVPSTSSAKMVLAPAQRKVRRARKGRGGRKG